MKRNRLIDRRAILALGAFAAITSSKILNVGKRDISAMLCGLNTTQSYAGIGVGNDTTAAAETQTTLLGTETSCKDGNASYALTTNSSYIASWNSSWVYGDLTTHIFREVVISDNLSNASTCLLRGVYDQVTLGASDSLSITCQVAIDESA